VKGTNQAILGSSDQQKVNISQLCFTEEKDLSTGPSVIVDLFPQPTGLNHRSQITEGLVLRPLSYTKIHGGSV